VVLRYLTPTASFSPLCRAFCAVVFSRGCVFLRYRPRGRTGFPLAKACPPVSGGVFVFGGGGVLACASPQSDVGRASEGCFWGSPYQRRRRIFAVPRWGAFPPPFWGGVYFLWIVAWCSSLSLWHGKAQSGRLSRRIGKECRQVRKRVLPFSVCPCAA
jgi:hypothetical protein